MRSKKGAQVSIYDPNCAQTSVLVNEVHHVLMLGDLEMGRLPTVGAVEECDPRRVLMGRALHALTLGGQIHVAGELDVTHNAWYASSGDGPYQLGFRQMYGDIKPPEKEFEIEGIERNMRGEDRVTYVGPIPDSAKRYDTAFCITRTK